MRRRAFTLVELLVVIGILAVLLGLLMPGLRAAREISRRTACAANLQHLGVAMVLYAHENAELYPFAAGVDQGGAYPADWIYWQGNRDVRKSAIARYINFQTSMLVCPSDHMDYHTRRNISPWNYPYSYTMNMLFSSYYAQYRPRTTSVRTPSEKILLFDEDEHSIDDGNFSPILVNQRDENFLAIRHDAPFTGSIARSADGRRGNVAFADGHVDFVDRYFTQKPAHYDPRQ